MDNEELTDAVEEFNRLFTLFTGDPPATNLQELQNANKVVADLIQKEVDDG